MVPRQSLVQVARDEVKKKMMNLLIWHSFFEVVLLLCSAACLIIEYNLKILIFSLTLIVPFIALRTLMLAKPSWREIPTIEFKRWTYAIYYLQTTVAFAALITQLCLYEYNSFNPDNPNYVN